MSVQLVHPDGIVKVSAHHQVSIGEGSRLIAMAGQVSWDADGTLVGAGDLAAQSEQAFLNVATALQSVDAGIEDLMKVTVFVVDLDPGRIEQVAEGQRRAAEKLGVEFQFPGTYVGVTGLFDPEYLIEVEPLAIVS